MGRWLDETVGPGSGGLIRTIGFFRTEVRMGISFHLLLATGGGGVRTKSILKRRYLDPSGIIWVRILEFFIPEIFYRDRELWPHLAPPLLYGTGNVDFFHFFAVRTTEKGTFRKKSCHL